MAEVVEESFETEVRRKVVRSAFKIEEVSIVNWHDLNKSVPLS